MVTKQVVQDEREIRWWDDLKCDLKNIEDVT